MSIYYLLNINEHISAPVSHSRGRTLLQWLKAVTSNPQVVSQGTAVALENNGSLFGGPANICSGHGK